MWSKLEYTEEGKEAKYNYAINNCEYHNWQHILQGYEYLENTCEPYNEKLDRAWLKHDIVYDKFADKELRSANTVAEIEVAELIMATKDHLVTDLSYSPIIRADLHGLTDLRTCVTNYFLILQESIKLYNISERDFAKANLEFMNGLKERILRNAFTLDPTHKDFYLEVVKGIETTRSISLAIMRSEL